MVSADLATNDAELELQADHTPAACQHGAMPASAAAGFAAKKRYARAAAALPWGASWSKTRQVVVAWA